MEFPLCAEILFVSPLKSLVTYDRVSSSAEMLFVFHVQYVTINHRRRNQGDRGARAPPPPMFYPRHFINIHAYSTDRRVAVYITFGPSKMELLPTPMLRESQSNSSPQVTFATSDLAPFTLAASFKAVSKA